MYWILIITESKETVNKSWMDYASMGFGDKINILVEIPLYKESLLFPQQGFHHFSVHLL